MHALRVCAAVECGVEMGPPLVEAAGLSGGLLGGPGVVSACKAAVRRPCEVAGGDRLTHLRRLALVRRDMPGRCSVTRAAGAALAGSHLLTRLLYVGNGTTKYVNLAVLLKSRWSTH